MSLNDEQYEKIDLMLSALEADPGALNDWEKNFIADQVKRFRQYGKEMYLSPKQSATIKKIYDAVVGDEPQAGPEDLDDGLPF